MNKNPTISPEEANRNGLLYDVGDCPPVKKAIPLVLQHMCAMFSATVLVPIIVNSNAGVEVIPISVALVMSGLGTLLYHFITKKMSPVYLGSSFAFIAPISATYIAYGLGGVLPGLTAVGLLYALFALIIYKAGTQWIDKLLPSVVIGPAILIIGVGLAPSAISQIGIDGSAPLDLRSLAVAVTSFAIAVIIMVYVRNDFLRIIPFLLAIIVGYVVAVCCGIVDFTPVKEAPWVAMPRFSFFRTAEYQFTLAGIAMILPVALATMAEHIGDHKAVSTIIGRDLLKKPGLWRTLLADGLATLLAVLFGAPPNTTYGENSAVVGMTKVASTNVIRWAAGLAILVGFSGKFTALISTIPGPVLGGVSILLYGFIGLNGVKLLIRDRINFDHPRNVVIVSTMLVIGFGGAVIAFSVGNAEVSFSGMSLATAIGVLLNLALPVSNEEKAETAQNRLNERRLAVLAQHPELQKQLDALIS